MAARLSPKANAELLGVVGNGMPHNARPYWYTADELQTMLMANGLPFLLEKAVSNAMRGRPNTVALNNYRNKNWYCFETDPDHRRFDTPTAQMNGLKREMGGEAELQTYFSVRDERREAINAIPSNHFANCCELQHLQQYAEAVGPPPGDDPARETRDDTTPRRVATDPARETARVTPSSAGEGARIATPAPSRPVVVQQATFGRGLSAAAARFGAPTPAHTKKKWRGSSKVPLPIDVPDGQHVGLVFSAIGKTTECVRIAEEHARRCHCKLQLTERVKSGFDLIETYGCGYCKKDYTIQSGPKADPTAARRQGGQESETSKIIAHSAHASAVNVSQLGEFLDQAGCVRASNTGLHKMYERRKAAVRSVCEDQLRQNRIDHVAAVRAKHGSECDVKHVDAEGNEHNICSGGVAYDGAGETRAYNHRITGSQHVTVLYSVETGKPLMVWHDQLSCGHCSRIITQLVVQQKKRPDEITEEDLKHEGKPCYRNTKHGPACAEEFAMEKIARALLIVPETGKLLPDDEAILGRDVIADGDTKGSKRFIAEQASIVPEFAGKAEYFPDIGHFVKCISGGFHRLAKDCAELRGVSLLESARIKTMVADISRVLRQYGEEYRGIGTGPNAQDEVAAKRKRAIERIAAIIPHHCGDHSHCLHDDCKMKQLQRHFICKHKVECPADKDLSDAEILAKRRPDIAKRYAEVARFKGKAMSMGEVGQQRVYQEIKSRLNESNIDRVARAMSSNCCENFFGVLAKFSHGKRINYGQSDSWEVYQLLVAGQRSDDRIEDKIQSHAGIQSSHVRDAATAKFVEKKQYWKEQKQKPEVKLRRKTAQLAKVKKAAQNTTTSAKHKPNKLAPTASCKSKVAKPAKAKRKRKSKCKNCKQAHEGPCEDPQYPGSKGGRKTKKQKKAEERQADLLGRFAELFG